MNRRLIILLALCAALSAGALAQSSTSAASQTSQATFDVEKATEAYLAKQTPEQKSRSDAYFEGGYWLILWSFLCGVAVNAGLLASGVSARMRDLAARLTRFETLRPWVYWALYLVVESLLLLPLTVYAGFFREKKYGLATQTFGPWLGDQAKGLAFGLVLGGLAVMGLYTVFRKTGRSWWIWGAVVVEIVAVVAIVIGPVFIEPAFNEYRTLEAGPVRDSILRLARANGIPAADVFVFDASKQTTRVSANVTGFLGTERIALNDNLLNRCSLPEIEAVMAHEMGHYVLNHIYRALLEIAFLIVAGFAFVRFAFDRAVARWGARWGVSGIADPAGFPLLMLLLSAFFFVATPLTNTMTRTAELEADFYGMNASRQPDGMAEVSLKLGDYRKLSPGPLEEMLFFDHPSGRTRIRNAMQWKAENLESLPAAGTQSATAAR